MNSKSQAMETVCVTWHCAYCLKLCGSPYNLCAGCKKRSYCTRECQIADWFNIRNGQGHVNWCRHHECGEEDADWEVVPIPNKGLGIRAKKLLPAGMKIIVEPVFYTPDGHPGIKDLGPENATLEQKFISNIFLGSHYQVNDMKPAAVALRIARVNHACQPNSATIYDETARVAILFAQKDIQPGEEITICYYAPFFWLITNESMLSSEEELSFLKNFLASKYGITCSTDCFCYDPGFLALVKEGRQLYETTKALACQFKTREALAAGEQLLDIYRRLNVSWEYFGRTEFFLFQIAICRWETLPKAKEYIRSAAELFGKICPYSEKHAKQYEQLLEFPEMHPEYMAIDRIGFNLVKRIFRAGFKL